MVMSLPLIPLECIPVVWRELKGRLESSQMEGLRKLAKYFDDTWVNGRWSPADWCQFGQVIRTNNDVEGYHNSLNQECQRPNLPFSQLVKILHKHSESVPITALRVFTGQANRIKKSPSEKRQEQLNGLWKKLDEKKMDALTVVEKASFHITPSEDWATTESRAHLEDDDEDEMDDI